MIPNKVQEQNCVNQMRKWINSTNHFTINLEDEFLLRFIRFRNYNVEEACKVLEKYMKIRDIHPYCYKNLDINDTTLHDLMKRGYIFPLLEKDHHNRTVIFCRSSMFSQKNGHQPTDVFRAIMMTFEILLDNIDNQKKGFVYIFDQNDVSISDVRYLGIWEMKKLIQSAERSLPIKHKEVHWLNLPPIILTVFNLIASFATEKLRKRLRFHKNIQSLHKSFKPSILPKEYGGEIPWKIMSDKWLATLKLNRKKLLNLEKIMDQKNGI